MLIFWYKYSYDYDMVKEIGAFTNLLFYLKFLLFFRVFQSFGIYFAIIIGVAKKVFPFLMVLFFILLGFAHAFFNILRNDDPFSEPPVIDNNSHNSWNLETKYYTIYPNNTIEKNPVFVESSPSVFKNFGNSLLSMYLILLGNKYFY